MGVVMCYLCGINNNIYYNHMTITATFTGVNSLGYENGKEYQLKVSDTQGVSVTRLDGTGKCPYYSLSAFLRNWNNVRVKV